MSTFEPLQITESATSEIKSIRATKGIPEDYLLRIGMQNASGCGSMGMSHLLGFDQQTEEDELYSINGIDVIIDKKHMMYILGVKVDFINTSETSGFVFKKD